MRAGKNGKEAATSAELRYIERLSARNTEECALYGQDLGKLTLRVDCSVVSSNGGVLAAVVSAAWLAIAQALSNAASKGRIASDVSLTRVASVAFGCFEDGPRIDLDSSEYESTVRFRVRVLAFDARENLIAADARFDSQGIQPEDFAAVLEIGKKATAQVNGDAEGSGCFAYGRERVKLRLGKR